ncbi:MAG: 3-oxoacyl-ACP reductase family protein [Chloroflexota bacterium]
MTAARPSVREPREPQPLHGKVALVTGGSRGIGRAIVDALAAAGAQVVVNYRVARDAAEAVAAGARSLGVRAVAVQADVSDAAAVERMFDGVRDAFGRLDVLVNNAGVMTQFRLEELTVKEWDRTIATNLRGVFLCCRAASPLLPRGGRVINVASQLAHAGAAELTHYCASKGAALLFTRALAREWGPRGITVNALAPGPMLTDLTRPYASPAWVAMKTANLALGRLGTPEDVAQTVLFLCSDAAALYTGQSLNPNGGGAMV